MQKPDFKALLREKGFKATPGRASLLEALWNEAKPAAASTLAKKLGKKMDEATLYRALEALARSGAIRRVDLGHAHAHYEFEKEHHHHVVCTDCGAVEDLSDAAFEKEVAKLMRGSKKFESIRSHNLEFFGNCKVCSA